MVVVKFLTRGGCKYARLFPQTQKNIAMLLLRFRGYEQIALSSD